MRPRSDMGRLGREIDKIAEDSRWIGFYRVKHMDAEERKSEADVARRRKNILERVRKLIGKAKRGTS